MCWLFICGVACGVTTWLFGFGGGFVTVPLISLLVTAAWGAQSDVGGQAMHIAVATSALVMLCAALLATWRHLRSGTLCWRPLRMMFVGIALGGIAGALLALSVDASSRRDDAGSGGNGQCADAAAVGERYRHVGGDDRRIAHRAAGRIFGAYLAVGRGIAGRRQLAGTAVSRPLADTSTGSLARADLPAVADSGTAGDEPSGIVVGRH